MRFTICLKRAIAGFLLITTCLLNSAFAQETKTDGSVAHPDAVLSIAPVEIDGTVLFRVAGVPALPASERAAAITERIEAVAADPKVKSDDVHTVEMDIGIGIVAGSTRVLVVTEDDARLEGVGQKVLVGVYVSRVSKAIDEWRAARTATAIEGGVWLALATTVAFALAVALLLWVVRFARRAMHRYRARIQSVGIQSFQLVRAERIWSALVHLLSVAGTVAVAILLFFYLDYVLGLFPWTRGASIRLAGYVMEPLGVLGRGFIDELPSLIFLTILFVLIRWILKMIRLFFNAIGRAEVVVDGFEAEWAEPTYKIVRVLVIVFALVVAYPYIPGSSSDAFKGISLFIGVIFSLGSSSIVANTLAGYAITYRRAFRIGDIIKIGDVMGVVTEMRLQVTHLRTIKNEVITVPNSKILGDEVMNYSTLAKTDGLIVHTTVGIGYETPWRQVEAMLIEAARRTSELKMEPPPFVRQQALGDFAITYEINVYCDNPLAMSRLYTELHRNILDVFNEYGVQIMTPAYEGDTPDPKVVPKDRWFMAPAQSAPPTPK